MSADEEVATPEASPADRRRRLAWALLVLVGLVLLGLIASRVGDRGRFALPYSTVGAGPDGARALYELLAQEGVRVEMWNEDVGRLPPGGALVILGGCDHPGARPMSRPERERLERWIDRGGTLIVAGAGGYVTPEMGASLRMREFAECVEDPGLVSLIRASEEEADAGTPAALPPPVSPGGAADPPPGDKPPADELLPDPEATLDALDLGLSLAEPIWGVPSREPLVGLPLIGMRNAGAIELTAGADARVLASTGGKIGIVEIRHGEGRLILLASASLFQNRDLVEHGGALVMTRLVRHYVPDGVVRFDEYHVGAGDRRSMVRYFTQAGVVPLVLQVFFGIGLFIFARSRRFGGVREPALAPTSSTTAFVSGLAGLFRASKDRAGTLAILARSALRRVADAHHQSEHEAHALAAALESRGRKAAADAVREIEALGKRGVSGAGELARASRDLDEAVARAVRREA